MQAPEIHLDRATGPDLAYVEGLLTEADLPAEDVRDSPGVFYVCYRGDERIGAGGIERYGRAALLRSVVVEPPNRGTGLGTALCDALETEAADAGVETLYLLTTTAAEFFSARGYDEVGREEPPAAIRNTREFRELCPSTAVCMRRQL